MKRNLIMIGAALLALAAQAYSSPELKSVRSEVQDKSVRIVVDGSGLTDPKVIRAYSGTSYIVEFAGELTGKPGRQHLNKNSVGYVQWGWYSARPPKVRVHVKLLDGSINPTLEKTESGYIIWVNKPKNAVTDSVAPEKALTADEMAMQEAIAKLKQHAEPPANNEKAVKEVPPVEKPGAALKEEIAKTQAKAVAQDSFPERVPPLDAVPQRTPVLPPVRQEPMVTLDFVGTDVLQIIKALSIQTGFNIIASPEVSPYDDPLRLTLSLHNVTVDNALNLISAMAGLRFARVGNTYVVTRTDQFNDAMRQILDRSGDRFETRVITLASGAASQIKDATLKAIPQHGSRGFYEIMVPGEGVQEAVQSQPTQAMPFGLPAGIDPASLGLGAGMIQPQTPAQPQNNKPKAENIRSGYLIVVGEIARLEEVAEYVRLLDRNIADSYSFAGMSEIGTVVIPIQSGQTERIKSMLEGLVAENPNGKAFTITESSLSELLEAEESTHVLLMIGPKSELPALERFAMNLDADLCNAVGIRYVSGIQDRERIYEVVELNYIEPTIAQFDLKNRVRGLHVTVLPEPVTPGIIGEEETEKQARPGDEGAEVGNKAELKRTIGREPMRLILRGTRQQIADARAYLAQVDLAPQQVALELRVMELTREDAQRVGIDWGLLTGGRLINLRVNQGTGDTADSPGTISGGYNFRGGDLLSGIATLDKIATNRNLIARPNALVSDGRSTSMFVGDTVRYVETIVSSQAGPTVQIGEIQVGVTFNVQARVGGNGNIALDLDQNFSILTQFLPVPGGGNIPQTSDRVTRMFVNMKSGETLAIGGLILEQDRKRIAGIPILMDLPIIGQFFSRTETSKERTEIVFFLTAFLVDDDNRSNAASPRTSETRQPDPRGDYLQGGGG